MAENIHNFIYEKDADGIVTITMDLTGPVNSMNDEYVAAMDGTVAKLEAESDITGIVFASAKSTFFAGGNLKDMLYTPKGQEQGQFDVVETIKDYMRRIEKMPVPAVAAINGAALGGGLEICLGCNGRVISNSPKAIIGLPEVTLGLLPGGGGIVRSIHMLGLQKALTYLLTGKTMQPAEALEAGFVDAIVPADQDLVAAAKDWIKANPERNVQPWDIKGHKIPGGDLKNPQLTTLLSLTTADIFKKTRGLLPAPQKILSVAHDVCCIGFDAAMRMETRALAYLVTHPVSKNIINSTFFQLKKINSGASRPAVENKAHFNKIAVVGAGMMGQGIAYCAAAAGIDVVLKDISMEAAEKGKAYSQKILDKQIQRGKMSQDKAETILAKIAPSTDYADLTDVDLVIEAVFENFGLKEQVINEIESHIPANALLCSNTSTLPITQLASFSKRPDQFIGMHFFSPVDRMALVELICGESTNDNTLAGAFDFVRQIRKTPIVANDSLGFFTSRVFATFLDEGEKMLEEGLDPVLIDQLSKQVGMPVGPLAMQDEVSHELLRKMAITHKEMGVYCSKANTDTCFSMATRLCDEFNRGGRHYGGGFYDYHDDGSKTIWPKIYEMYHKPEVSLPNEDVKERILFRQVIETLKCLQENVLMSVADANIGSLFGIGAPTWTGGFVQVVNTYEFNGEQGPKAFAARCQVLASKYGERFNPPQILLDQAASNEWFE